MVVKPWFQAELERVTRERWRLTQSKTGMVLRCSHGMRIFRPYPKGLERPFLNDTAEREFVGKVLPAHRPWEEVLVPYKEFGFV